MPFADILVPFVPWIVLLSSFLAGILLNASVSWCAQRARAWGWNTVASGVAALRDAIVLYALALGLYVAPFSYSPKGELIAERVVNVIALIATTIVAERLLAGGVTIFTRRYAVVFSSASLLVSLVRGVTVTVGILVILQSLGIAIAPIITALGVGGLAVALALQSTLANLFAGLQIIAARQVHPGDYVKLDGTGGEGFVVDITWRSTTIRNLNGNLVVVPNQNLASAIVINYSLPDQRMLISVDCVVRHGTDLQKAQAVALDTARAVVRDAGGNAQDEPFVRFKQISDAGIAFVTFMSVTRFMDQFLMKSLFVERLYERFQREGNMLSSQGWAEVPIPPPQSPTLASGQNSAPSSDTVA